jgi:hypothetical protein
VACVARSGQIGMRAQTEVPSALRTVTNVFAIQILRRDMPPKGKK